MSTECAHQPASSVAAAVPAEGPHDAHIILPDPFIVETDSPFPWLYRSHTAAGLLTLGAAVALWLASPTLHGWVPEAWRPVVLPAVAFLAYCGIHLHDGLLSRPHPAVWRVVQGCGLLYVAALLSLTARDAGQVRPFLRQYIPGAGAPHQHSDNEVVFVDDCRIWTPEHAGGPFAHITAAFGDVYVWAHSFGWAAKALLLRDWRLCWCLSIGWELVESTAAHFLPNLHECS